jgi:hypothetical protein
MRIVLFLFSLFSLNIFACIPCDKEASKMIYKVPKPSFPVGFYGKQERGYVKYKIGNGNASLAKKITIISLIPTNTPKESIMEMLNKIQYRSVTKKHHHSACIESFEFETEFKLPQRVMIDNKVDISKPVIKINNIYSRSVQLNETIG